MDERVTERELRLISLAIVLDLDSSDVEECCRRHGLDYGSAPFAEIRKVVVEDYGFPPLFPPHTPASHLP